jgi:hypothetical protein
MSCRIPASSLGVIAALVLSAVVARGDIVLDPAGGASVGYVQVDSGSASMTGTPYTITSPLTLPPTQSVTDGTDLSTATYSLSGTNFNVGFVQSRGGALPQAGASSNGTFFFKATDQYTDFTLDGSYTYTSPRAFISVELYDQTSGADYYELQDVQNNLGLGAGTLIVGSQSPPGSLSGALTLGDHYEFLWEAFTQAYPNADGGASATGNLGISFTDTAAVPLPATAYAGLGLLGGLGCWMVARRRKVAAE